MFKNTKISTKILLMMLSSIIIISLVLTIFSVNAMNMLGKNLINTLREQVTDQEKSKIQQLSETAYSIMEYYNQQVQEKKMSLDTARKLAYEQIGKMRYDDGRGYFWVNNTEKPYGCF